MQDAVKCHAHSVPIRWLRRKTWVCLLLQRRQFVISTHLFAKIVEGSFVRADAVKG